MAFTSPFFQGTQAQGIINSYLNAGGFSQPYTTASTNPYKVDVTPYVPPAAQPTPDTPNDIPNCEEMYPGEGRIYDPVLQACVLQQKQNNDNDNETPKFYEGNTFLPMANDPVNTELRRFAGQEDYHPTFMDSMNSLKTAFLNNSLFGSILQGLNPNMFTQKVDPRFSPSGNNPFTSTASGAPVTANPQTMNNINNLVNAGASQPAVESAFSAVNNPLLQQASRDAYNTAQNENRNQSNRDKQIERQNISQSRIVDTSTGNRIRGGI